MEDRFLAGESKGKFLLLNSGSKLKARIQVAILGGEKETVFFRDF